MPVVDDDHRAITDLTIAYAWTLDEGRFDDLGEVFTQDATADLGGIHNDGLEAIIDRIRRALSHLDASQHVLANHQIRVDGDTATCRCYLVAQHVKRGTPGGDNFVVAGIYKDALTRTSEGWRVTHRDLTVTWTEGNPAILDG